MRKSLLEISGFNGEGLGGLETCPVVEGIEELQVCREAVGSDTKLVELVMAIVRSLQFPSELDEGGDDGTQGDLVQDSMSGDKQGLPEDAGGGSSVAVVAESGGDVGAGGTEKNGDGRKIAGEVCEDGGIVADGADKDIGNCTVPLIQGDIEFVGVQAVEVGDGAGPLLNEGEHCRRFLDGEIATSRLDSGGRLLAPDCALVKDNRDGVRGGTWVFTRSPMGVEAYVRARFGGDWNQETGLVRLPRGQMGRMVGWDRWHIALLQRILDKWIRLSRSDEKLPVLAIAEETACAPDEGNRVVAWRCEVGQVDQVRQGLGREVEGFAELPRGQYMVLVDPKQLQRYLDQEYGARLDLFRNVIWCPDDETGRRLAGHKREQVEAITRLIQVGRIAIETEVVGAEVSMPLWWQRQGRVNDYVRALAGADGYADYTKWSGDSVNGGMVTYMIHRSVEGVRRYLGERLQIEVMIDLEEGIIVCPVDMIGRVIGVKGRQIAVIKSILKRETLWVIRKELADQVLGDNGPDTVEGEGILGASERWWMLGRGYRERGTGDPERYRWVRE